MKYLRKYESHSKYSGDYNNIKNQKVCVSLVKDECTKMPDSDEVKNRIFFKSKSYDAWAGDLLCWNTTTKDWEVIAVDKTQDTITLADNLIPDAVCVMPACHADDGKARWCALNDAKNDALKSETNGDKHLFMWEAGGNFVMIDELGKFGVFPRAKFTDTNSDGIAEDYSNTKLGAWEADSCFMVETGPNILLNPYNIFGNAANDEDYGIHPSISSINGAGVKLGVSRECVGGPWVYEQDGFSKNPIMFMAYYSEDNSAWNALMDNDGKRNTQILLKHSPNGTEYPAALAASLYEQTYSPAGSWYLPAAGEFAYLVARWYTIQHTLYVLQQVSTGKSWSASPLGCNDFYWSSTQVSADCAVNLDTDSGALGWDGKDSYCYVRPFRSF